MKPQANGPNSTNTEKKNKKTEQEKSKKTNPKFGNDLKRLPPTNQIKKFINR